MNAQRRVMLGAIAAPSVAYAALMVSAKPLMPRA